MTTRSFLRNDGQFQQVDAGSISISTTTTTAFLTYLTKSTTADVALNDTTLFFDGPVVSQGSSGTWFVAGTVTVTGNVASQMLAKLWDGSTIIASCEGGVPAAPTIGTFSLSGVLALPAGNLRISVKDITNVSGTISANLTGLSKDSTITAIRIG